MPLFSPIVASGQNIGWSDVPLVRGAANTLSLENSTNAMALWVHGTTDSTRSNYRRIRLSMTTGGAATIAAEGLGTGVSGNTLEFSINGTQAVLLSGATAAMTVAGTITSTGGGVTINTVNSFRVNNRFTLYASSDGQYVFGNWAVSDADIFLKLGVNTSAAAGIKRVGTVLQSRLNDDSAFATIQGKLRTDNAYAAGAPGAATGTVTITDSTGTEYRIPVLV